MNDNPYSLLLQMQDIERYLTFIIKNSHFDGRCKQVADAHYKDMQTAITNCRRVIDEVLVEQHKACN